VDPTLLGWGESPYWRLRLEGCVRLKEALEHLYVLVPAMDRDKHYFINADEVDKLLAHGGAWLASHPEREWITRRYLKGLRSLTKAASGRLDELASNNNDTSIAESHQQLDGAQTLDDMRQVAVVDVLRELKARAIVDLGCGEGRLILALADHLDLPQKIQPGWVSTVVGMDACDRPLARARQRVADRLAPLVREKITFFRSSLTYLDDRLKGFDAATLVEVIEHQDPWQLSALERAVFGHAKPTHVVVTTPNQEFNQLFPWLPAGQSRHSDHRFEWTRSDFRAWGDRIAATYGYQWTWRPVGISHPELGPPTQMGVFSR